jgi:hypothetical protein
MHTDNTDFYLLKYPREKEIAFTGMIAKDNPWLLSNGQLSKYNSMGLNY